MTIDDLERCPECGASIGVYERDCAGCGADLFEAKSENLRDLREGGGMTPEAYEIAVEILREGPRPSKPAPRGERKQVTELTLADLERCPVWEFAIDEEGEPGQDEETLRPRRDVKTVDPEAGLFLLPAKFQARDGSVFAGFLSLGLDPGDIQPTIVTEDGEHVSFWFGIAKPAPAVLARAYRALGLAPTTLFPVRYEATVPTTQGTPAGEIEGFAYYEKYPDVRVFT